MFSTVLASLTLFWFCLLFVCFGHTLSRKKFVLTNLNAIFPDNIYCDFSYKKLF